MIQDGFKMPTNDLRGRKAIYPWAEMTVGQSFQVDRGKLESVRICAAGYGKRHEREYRVAWYEPDGEYRCWRVA